MSLVLGVFGPIGAGKTTVSLLIQKKYDYFYLNADTLGHQIIELPLMKKKMVDLFGLSVCTETGEIDRKKVRQVVFNDSTYKNKLESILWPKMTNEIKKKIKNQNKVVFEAAVLFSAGWNQLCDFTIYVGASPATIHTHCQTKFTKTEVERVLYSQQTIIEQRELADFQLTNDEGIEVLDLAVMQVMESIQKRGMK